MSRCFPFPPPGYAKKALTHDVDLLKKEKEKEKKRKKEKKDKKKRENTEKREEKDRSDEKHRGKKDSKENHRDKKDREIDKHGSSHAAGEKKLSGQSEGRNKEKTSDDKKLDKKTEGQSGEEGRKKDRIAGQLSGFNGQRLSQNSHLALDSRNSTFVQGLGRKVRNEDRETSNQLVDKFMGPEKKREGTAKLVSSKSAKSLVGGKEKNETSEKKLDAEGFGEETRLSTSVLVHNHSEAIPIRTDGITRQVEKDTHWRMEGKGSDHMLEDKHKDNDREKKNHAKDKDKEKERTKTKDDNEVGEHGSLNKGTKVDLIDTVDGKTYHPPKGSYKTAVPEENLRKRKDFEKNGYANDHKASKLARSTASHPLKDDSRTLQSCQASNAADGHGQEQAAANSKVDDILHKENGIVHAQTISFSLTKPSLVSATAGQVKEESSEPPHPDIKYLSKVLSVPKLEINSDFDAQEWLYDESGSHLKKPKIGSSEFDETPQVWAEAQRIESADICALPYVIPY